MSDDLSSAEPPEDYDEAVDATVGRQSVGGQTVADAGVLVVKDCDPWNAPANEIVLDELETEYTVIGSSSLDDVDLQSFSTVVLPSTQTEAYYTRLADARSAIESFVENGGVLVAHITDNGWPCNAIWEESFLPAGVEKVNQFENELVLSDSDHPIADGISQSDLQDWNHSAHGYLLPTEDQEEVGEVELVSGISNGNDFPPVWPTHLEYEYGQGTVIATTQTLEWPWASTQGTKELLRNELEYAVDMPEVVTGSATTVQYIPGRNENVEQGGHPLDGGLMRVFSEDELISVSTRLGDYEIDLKPALDSWLKGDQTYVQDEVRPGNDELPERLKDTRQGILGKYEDEFDQREFDIIRFENGVTVSFETKDGETVEADSLQITFNEAGEVGDNLGIGDISLEGREETPTVTPDHEVNGIPVDEWHDGIFEEQATRQDRAFWYDTDYEYDGIEGVRVLTVSGAYAGFVDDWSERASQNPVSFANETIFRPSVPGFVAEAAWLLAPPEAQVLMDFLTVVPNTYSILEFIVLADGRRFARVWNASMYPSLALYVDGIQRDQVKMDYEPNEALNLNVLGFFIQASAGMTPYPMVTQRIDRFRGVHPWEENFGDAISDFIDPLPDIGFSVADFLPTVPWLTVGIGGPGESDPIPAPDSVFEGRVTYRGKVHPK